jgi:hypothetical protein
LVYAKNSAGKSPAAEWNGDLLRRHDRSLAVADAADGWIYFIATGYGGVGDYQVVHINTTDDLATAYDSGATFANTANTHAVISGLANGVTYYFWIQARTYAGGESDWSGSASATPHMTRPAITQIIPGDTSIWVEWQSTSRKSMFESVSVPSAPFYEVWCYETNLGSETARKVAEIQSDPAVILYSQTLEGLTNFTEYTVYVKAKSEYDSGDSTEWTATPRTVPATPVISALTAGVGQITVNWSQAPTAAFYEILYNTINDSLTADKYGEVLDPTTSVTIRGLARNTTYYVWLRAKNDQGSGFYSAPASGTTPASGVITVDFDGGLTVKDESGKDVSGGFTLGASESLTLSADGGFADAIWYVDGASAGNTITLSGAMYNDFRDHSVTFTGKKGGRFYSSDPIPFRVTP